MKFDLSKVENADLLRTMAHAERQWVIEVSTALKNYIEDPDEMREFMSAMMIPMSMNINQLTDEEVMNPESIVDLTMDDAEGFLDVMEEVMELEWEP